VGSREGNATASRRVPAPVRRGGGPRAALASEAGAEGGGEVVADQLARETDQAQPASNHAPSRLPASRLMMIGQCTAISVKGTGEPRAIATDWVRRLSPQRAHDTAHRARWRAATRRARSRRRVRESARRRLPSVVARAARCRDCALCWYNLINPDTTLKTLPGKRSVPGGHRPAPDQKVAQSDLQK
jgi:hypothetical protein